MARPVKWKTPEDLQVAIDAYFVNCDAKEIPYTVTGLALACDLTRQGMLEYCAKSDAFSDTIKKAKSKVEHYIEVQLYKNNATGCIFNLKNNFGWKDKTEQELTGKDGAALFHPVKVEYDNS